MVDKIRLGSPRPIPTDITKRLLSFARRQTNNEAGALIDPSAFYQRQYSIDGETDWHDDFAEGDLFAREKSGASDWTTPFRIIGEMGPGGGNYVDFRFQRAATQPATPTGDTPAGWSDGPPAANGNPLWAVKATKTQDGVLVGGWSTPSQWSGDQGPQGQQGQQGQQGPQGNPGPTGNYVEQRYARAATLPATPTGDTPAGWATTPPEANGNPLWMTKATKTAVGALVGVWSTPVQITGDTGDSIYIEYSPTGYDGWHDPPALASDNFSRQKQGAGGTWSPAALFVGTKGDTGNTGAAGANGRYIAVAYKTGPTSGISAPTGNGPVPTGWSGVPYAPTGTDVLWVSRATCEYDNTLVGSWSAPAQYLIRADYIKANVEMASPIITTPELRGGKTSFADTATGFWMGLVSSVAKFIIGSATKYLSWDGTDLKVVGGVITGGTLQTAPDGPRAVVTSASVLDQGVVGAVEFYDEDGAMCGRLSKSLHGVMLDVAGADFDLIGSLECGGNANVGGAVTAYGSTQGSMLVADNPDPSANQQCVVRMWDRRTTDGYCHIYFDYSLNQLRAYSSKTNSSALIHQF